MLTKSRLALAAFFVAVLTLVPLSASASVPKIEATPSSSSLTPGQSVAVNFVLDNPIVCATNPCDVTLDFAGAQTLGLTASPSSVNWTANQWPQVRTITFTLDANTPATYPEAVVLRAIAQSNSEYYRAFAVDVTINLVVPDNRPSAAPDQLAVTGGNMWQAITLALISMTAGLGLCATGAYVRRQRLR